MKTNYVGLNSVISDWVEDSGSDSVQESILRRWAMDVVKLVSTDEQLVHRIGLLDIKNTKVRLPDDFKLVCEVAYKQPEPTEECFNVSGRTRVSQWVQNTPNGCEIEINLKCPKCQGTECTCTSPVIEVDIDRIHQAAHPEYYYKHFTRRSVWGEGISVYNPKFILMTPTPKTLRTSHIPGCRNAKSVNDCAYSINQPFLETNRSEGEILLSYMGWMMDESGDIMIPDHPDVHNAIFYALEFKYFWRKWRNTGELKYARIYKEAKQNKREAIGAARSALQIPDHNEFTEWVENTWLKRLPGNRAEQYKRMFE